MGFAAVEGGEDLVEGALACVIFAVVVVEFFWAVDTNSNEEFIFVEKIAPVIVEKDCVCLQGISDLTAFGGVFFLKFDGPFVEVEAHKSGFTPLPREAADGQLQLQVVFCHLFEDGVGHSLAARADLGRAVFVEAVSAIEVAIRAGRFYKESKRLHRMIITKSS